MNSISSLFCLQKIDKKNYHSIICSKETVPVLCNVLLANDVVRSNDHVQYSLKHVLKRDLQSISNRGLILTKKENSIEN